MHKCFDICRLSICSTQPTNYTNSQIQLNVCLFNFFIFSLAERIKREELKQPKWPSRHCWSLGRVSYMFSICTKVCPAEVFSGHWERSVYMYILIKYILESQLCHRECLAILTDSSHELFEVIIVCIKKRKSWEDFMMTKSA